MGTQAVDLVLHRVQRRLRYELLLEQLVLPLQVALGVGEVGAALRHLRLSLAEVGVLGAHIEREKPVAAPHRLPFLDMDGLDGGTDLGPHIDRFQRGHGGVGTEAHRHIGGGNHGTDDGNYAGAPGLGRLAARVPEPGRGGGNHHRDGKDGHTAALRCPQPVGNDIHCLPQVVPARDSPAFGGKCNGVQGLPFITVKDDTSQAAHRATTEATQAQKLVPPPVLVPPPTLPSPATNPLSPTTVTVVNMKVSSTFGPLDFSGPLRPQLADCRPTSSYTR
ncbi:MAG: hypothetical protein AW12_00175 [Candidatus Accumulibacter sp. BA-94]|nr:MAG: hypothetical protein AW12_00175 [Candidatus Accumulibacter sp. BA-94]